jgi:hypothetical protein
VATVAVVAFVGYLLAANFGLVPSPLTPLLGGTAPAIATISAPADVATAVSIPEPPPAAVDRPPAIPPPASAGPTDTADPAVKLITEDGASFGVTEAAQVTGTATDTGSGVGDVTVVFKTASGTSSVPAKVSCTDASRRACTWTATVPGVLANYVVSAKATDREGNVGSSKTIDITVVNAGGAVEQVGETVGRAPGAVAGAVGGLLDAVGGLVR